MTAFELLGMFDAEGTHDVALTLGGAGTALLGGVAVSDEGFGVDLSRHDFGDAATEQFALVVTAAEATSPVEGYGDQQVDVVEAAGVKQVKPHLASHEETQVAILVELHGMDEPLDGIVFVEGEERGGVLEVVDASAEESFGVVLVVAAVAGTGEGGQAMEADLAFAAHQHFVATGAGGGEYGL